MIKKIFKAFFFSLILLQCFTSIVFADTSGTTSPSGIVNSNMYGYIDKVENTIDMVGWHYSGGYWGFGYPNKNIQEANLSYKVTDANVPYFFTGTSKIMPFTICQRYTLPQSIKNFIYCYGTNQLGIRFGVAQSDMLNHGQFSYKVTSDYLYVSFTPIINYYTYNYWGNYNPTVWNKMTHKIYVPYIKVGYGINALSAFGGNDSFAINANIVRSAYKGGDGNLHFNRDENVWMFSSNRYLNVRNVYSESTFWGGGNNGLHYYFPVSVYFYGMNIRHNGISLQNYEYHSPDGTYWVKSGDNFNICTSATSVDQNGIDSIDDIVKVNSLHINVSNGSTSGYLDAKTHYYSNSIESENNASATSLINLASGSGYRSGATLYNTFTTNITGDKDLHLHGLARLVNYPTSGSFSPEYVWKSAEWDGIAVKSDSKAPTIGSAWVEKVTSSGFDVVINNVNDNGRSGVNHINTVAYYNGDWQNTGQWKDTYCSDGANLRIRVNSSDFGGKSGTYNFDIRTYDNVGNGGQVIKNFWVYVPYWTNPSTQYGGVWKDTGNGPGESVYTSTDGVKWVRPIQSFYISSVGHSNSADQQIDEAHLKIYNANSTGEEQLIKSGCARNQISSSNYWQDSSPVNTIKYLGGGGFLRRGDDWNPNANGKYVESYYKMSLTTDNYTYLQGSRMLCIDGGNYYWSNNGNFDNYNTIKTDGIAPNGTVDLNYYNLTSEMKITVRNIVEIGSGVNKIWAEYIDKDNPLNIIIEELTNIDGNYQGQENLYNLFGGAAETVNIKIKAIDNVGNERTLSDTDTNMFSVEANITRVLEPHDPVFKSGEKGILNINVYGGVDTLKITFPTELTTLDSTLNKKITLTPKVSDTVNDEFYIPITTLNNNYYVEVKAYRKGKEKIVYPPFTVNGNILNSLRTRIRKGN